MRFVCDSCRAQYMISDDKVGPKGVKVRCKKCGHMILVRKADAAPSFDAGFDAEATQVMQSPMLGQGGAPDDEDQEPPTRVQSAAMSQQLFGALDDEIGAVFDTVLNSGKHQVPGTDGASGEEMKSTRVMDALAVNALAQGGDEESASEDAGPSEDHDWYVAIDEKQSGPFKLEKIKSLWDSGEIGPDNLCWRTGLSDWSPLSEISELASVVAPRPKKPVIVAAQPSSSVSAPSAPVESAFSAGSVGRGATSGTTAPSAGADEDAPSGWKPSAASALASLAQEEMSALSRPARSSVSPAPAADAGLGLLDLPGDPPAGANATLPPRAAVPTYSPPPFQSSTPHSGNKTLIALGGAGLVVLVALVGVVVWAVTRQPSQVVVPAPVVAQPTPAPAPAPAPAPVAAAPAAAPAPNPTAPAAAAAAANGGGTAVAAAANPPPPEPAKAEGSSERRERNRDRSGNLAFLKKEKEKESSGSQSNSGTSKGKGEGAGTDDEFDQMFGGGGGGKKKQVAEAPPPSEEGKTKKSVYIPPAPGEGGGAAVERLGQADIMQVVLANRGSIKNCVDEQKKKNPDASGKLVMRWTIQTSGKTSGVSCRSDEFKSTYMAVCVTGLIKSWQFPKHKVQGDPIDFPFTF